MTHQHLYFIALIPPIELRERIKALKEEMKETFKAQHALKSPAHITLQMPFKCSNELEPFMFEVLEEFSSHQTSFKISLLDFDCFTPRVIFVKVKNHASIKSLHSNFIHIFSKNMDIGEKVISWNIHPHMTIATRDLSFENFNIAWPIFKEKEFEASFLCKSLFLLKHNGKSWDIHREFLFKRV